MSGWTCPNEIDGMCMKVRGFACTPGMKGCVLYGKVERKSSEEIRTLAEEEIIQKSTEGPAGSWDEETIRQLYGTRRKF